VLFLQGVFTVDKSNVLIIAEAGVNHNGDVNLAKKLIDVAVESGVDIVKFQTFKAENLVTKKSEMAKYQIDNIGETTSQYAMLKKLELSEADFFVLQDYCHQKKIRFFSTGFDMESLAFLKKMKMGLWKIPSGEITNLPYLEFIGACNDTVILSTGMANLAEVKEAFDVLVKAGTAREKISVLHCNTDYPTKFEDVNLRAMMTMHNELKCPVGYSDHTMGVEIPIAAVAMGAKIIEKHFTLDRNLPGPDHKASLEPLELKEMVLKIRNIEKALGNPEKKPSESEKKNIGVARKSIVAKKDIKIHEYFTQDNLTTKRPGTGICPMKWHDILGTKALKNYSEDDLI
jgi:N,N'-diacetyllegionaminate synthase